ncbi:MAG: DUF1858 domain-containing protein [Nitrospirae bacterium]|nr:DUF1858 domain-containing protein [Nitrospirota bacterium]
MIKLNERTGGILKIKEVKMTTKVKVTKDTVIGELIKDNPAATKVIEKYFGNGCFTCPGIKVESISFGAMMHNVDPNKIVEEINSLEE